MGSEFETTADPSDLDIVDEALDLFRVNCLFRNFEIKVSYFLRFEEF
jgi:hypothetical protein